MNNALPNVPRLVALLRQGLGADGRPLKEKRRRHPRVSLDTEVWRVVLFSAAYRDVASHSMMRGVTNSGAWVCGLWPTPGST